MKPNPDIYALVFASFFKLEIIDKHRWDSKVKDDAERKYKDNFYKREYRKERKEGNNQGEEKFLIPT